MAYIGTSPTQAVRTRFLYTATASQTTFSGADTQNLTLRYSDANFVDVYQNGVLLKGGGADYTATTTTSVVLATGATADDVIEIIVYDVFAVANLIKKDGDTVEGVINFNGKEITLDADFDTSLTSDTDDQIDIKIAGSDSLRIKANEIENVSGDFTLDVAGDIILDADGGQVHIRDGVTDIGVLENSSSDFKIESRVQDKDIIFAGNDGGSGIEAMRIDMSVGGFLGIGTTSPSSRLNIVGDAFTKSTIRLERTGGGTDNDAGLQFKSAAGANDDTAMGGIWFQNALDDNAYALIRSRTDDSTGTSGRLDFITSQSAVGNSTAASMTINSSGNVGIGTASPSVLLDLESTDPKIRLTDSDASGTPECEISGGGGDLTLRADRDNEKSSSIMGFEVDGSERMRIGSGSYILIGKTSTANGEQSAGVMIGHNQTSNTNGRLIVSSQAFNAFSKLDANGEVIKFFRSSTDFSNTEVGSIDVDGSSTSYGTSSDYRLKENIVTDWDATTRLKQLKPSRFNFKVDKDKTVDGFLAHEVSDIVPEAIGGEKDAVDKDGNIQPQRIDQSKLVPLLTKSLQEALARIDTLEAEVKVLKGE